VRQDATFVDVILSVIIGGVIGWVTGGIYNVINGRRWSGKNK
jgi:hypothetical protein